MPEINQPDFGISILVIDDDAMVRSVVVGYLKSFGFFNIATSPGGNAALKLIHDKRLHIDLILSDWEMPEVDGYTILKAVRNSPIRRDVKFMMITSQQFQEREKISKARNWKVNAYIIKPFHGELLREKIWDVLGWKQTEQRETG